MAQFVEDGPIIEPDVVFEQRLRLARARASELLATVRELAGNPPKVTNDLEGKLRIMEGEIASALHWANSIKRSAG